MKAISVFALCILSLSVTLHAQERLEHDGITAIKEIRESWLIIRLPGFEKKLLALDSLLERKDLSPATREKLEQARSQTRKDKELIHHWYPIAFDSAYSYSRFAFIYTHETNDFQNGGMPARSSDGEGVFYAKEEQYFFATLDGYIGDEFRFTDSNHHSISYPLPNNIAMSGILIPGMSGQLPAWVAAIEEDQSLIYRIYRHAARVNRKLSNAYRKRYLSKQTMQPVENQ